QERGLEVGTVSKAASEEKKGTVISSDPSAGESVPEGTKVNLTVSTGAVEVPDVVGQDEGQAKATLTSAGFQVKVIPQETEDADPGEVIAQSPEGGETAKKGTRVAITVAREPEEEPT